MTPKFASSSTGGSQPVGVLFVCHANLCRSPLAQGIFAHLVAARGLADAFCIDSAGCWAHEGLRPHPQSVLVAARHGLDLPGLVGASRSIAPEDLHRFDHILAMDRANFADLSRLRRLSGAAGPGRAHIRLLRQVVDPGARGVAADVPDPVGRDAPAYEATYQLLQQGCTALLAELTAQPPLGSTV